MANMREIKLRMKSIKETRQITKAMKLISAAKLKKAKAQLEETLPYFRKVGVTIADILTHSGEIQTRYCRSCSVPEEGKVVKTAYVIIAGDKGLAGGYNHNLNKLAESMIRDKENSVLYVVGYLGRNYFLKQKYNVKNDFTYPVQNPSVYRARDIAEAIIEGFDQGEYDEVHMIFTEMKSSIKLEPKAVQLLPLDLNALRRDLGVEGTARTDENLLYEPSPSAVFDVLIRKYVKGMVYGALVEAFTSEQSARMNAMDNATANAEEMLQKLNLYYNRARQASITQEISEIVGGAAALE